MMRRLFRLLTPTLLLLLVVCSVAFGQKQGRNWYFGVYAGLSFASADPVPLLDGKLQTTEGCSVQSDTAGNLLFYTDGEQVWDRRHEVMPMGTSMKGASSSTQSCIIVPQPGKPGIYYIFTTDEWENVFRGGFNYSIVDMSRNNGYGDMRSVDNPLAPLVLEKVTAIPDDDNTGMWIIAHGVSTDEFFKWKLTKDGITQMPTQRIGPVLGYGDAGYMKADPGGNRIAMASNEANVVFVCRFDRETGELYSPITFPAPAAYGVEFSPNSRFLYSTRNSDKYVRQYDLFKPDADVAASEVTVATTAAADCAAIQLAPNGRLYVAHMNSDHLSEIRSPNNQGAACNYRDLVVDLGGRFCQYGLPNFLPAIYSPEIMYDIVAPIIACVGDSIPFTISPNFDITNAKWVFDDLSSGPRNTATGVTTSHVFKRPGNYDVEVTFGSLNVPDRVRIHYITIKAPPEVHIGPDKMICGGSSLKMAFSTTDSKAKIKWEPDSLFDFPASPNPTLRTKSSVQVTVSVTSEFGCVGRDTMNVTIGDVALTVSPDTTICNEEVASLKAEGAVSYAWTPTTGLSDPTSATPTAKPLTTTTYRVIGTSGTCTDTAFVTVRVSGERADLRTNDTTICKGSSVVLEARGGTIYRWSPTIGLDNPSSPAPNASPVVSTRYWLVVDNGSGCIDTASVLVTVLDSLPLKITNDTMICIGTTLELRATGAGGAIVKWSNSINNAISYGNTYQVTPTQTTTYTAEVNISGCTGKAEVVVTVATPYILSISKDTSICRGGSVELNVIGAIGKVQWTPATGLSSTDQPTTMASPTTSTTYTCSVDNNGCISSATVNVGVVPARLPQLATTQVLSVQPGIVLNEQISIDEPVSEALPGLVAISWYERIMTVTPAANFVEVSRSTNDKHVVTVLYRVESIQEPQVLTTLEYRFYLTNMMTAPVTLSYTTESCPSLGTVEVVVQVNYNQCASTKRYLTIGNAGNMSIEVTPNPATNAVVTYYTTPYVGPHSMKLIDMQGRTILSEDFNVSISGDGTLPLDITSFSSGWYILELQALAGSVRVPVYKTD